MKKMCSVVWLPFPSQAGLLINWCCFFIRNFTNHSAVVFESNTYVYL